MLLSRRSRAEAAAARQNHCKERVTCLFHQTKWKEERESQGIRGFRKNLSCSSASLCCHSILLHPLKEVAQMLLHRITGITPKFLLSTESLNLEFQLSKQTVVIQTGGATHRLWESSQVEPGQHHYLDRRSSRKDCVLQETLLPSNGWLCSWVWSVTHRHLGSAWCMAGRGRRQLCFPK